MIGFPLVFRLGFLRLYADGATIGSYNLVTKHATSPDVKQSGFADLNNSGRIPSRCRRRNGVAVIIMVIVLGGLVIALLTLAGQTSIQMKSIRNTSLDTQQCNELIALGEKILAARLLANPEFSNEIIRVDLPQSFAVANQPRPQIGIVELTMIEKSDTDTDAQHVWTIHASFGASEGQLKHASRNVYPRTEKK